MHNLFCGMTGSGKSTMAKMICNRLNKAGKSTAVLDPLGDPAFEASFHTKDSEQFLSWAKSHRDCYLFIDEGGTAIGRYNAAMDWIATTARHCGHLSFIIVQGLTQLNPLVRGQCDKVYLFRSSKNIGEMLAAEWNEPRLAECDRLGQGEFFLASRFGTLKKGKILLDKGDVMYTILSESESGRNPGSLTNESDLKCRRF